MDYGAILTRTWGITWRYKGLWILGLLASCGAAGRSNSNGGGGGAGYNFSGSKDIGRLFEAPDEAVLIAIAVALIILVLFIALFFLLLSVLGQSGLIASFSRADDGYDVSVGEAFRLGMPYFWKLLGIRLLVWLAGLLIIIVILAVSIPFFIATMGVGLLLIPLCLCCLLPLLPLFMLVDAYVILTMVAAVEEDLSVTDSFRRSWQLCKENFGPVLVMTLILILGTAILSFVLVLPFLIMFVPIVIGFLVGGDQSIAAGMIVSGLCLLISLPFIFLINAVITTFTTGGWTITYRRLIGREGVSELGAATTV
jgi:hypothetical protein